MISLGAPAGSRRWRGQFIRLDPQPSRSPLPGLLLDHRNRILLGPAVFLVGLRHAALAPSDGSAAVSALPPAGDGGLVCGLGGDAVAVLGPLVLFGDVVLDDGQALVGGGKRRRGVLEGLWQRRC